MAQSATRTNEMRAISDESASAAIGDPTVVGTQSRASVHTNSSATALARRLKGLVRAVLPRCQRSVWPLAITLLVTVLSAGSGVGAAGLVAAAHPAGTPRAPSALPAGLVAALHCALRALPDAHSAAWGVPRGERPAHYRLPQQGPRDRAVNPVQGSGPPPARAARKGIAFTPPGLPLPPTGTTAHAVLINPWAQQNRLSAADATGGDNAGLSVVLSGTTAVVGVPGKNGSTGAAYVFVHSGTHWSQQARLTASDGVAGDQFGFSVALSGDAAMVGAPFKNTQTGAAYVFVRRGTGWHQQNRLTASGAAGGDWFGFSVALSGSTALVGAPQTNSSRGAAYVFVRRGTAWHQQARLTAGDAAEEDNVGLSVAVSADTAVAGAPGQNGSSGAGYVFVRSGTAWYQQTRLTAGHTAAGDDLGTSVALSGNTALVGAPGKSSSTGAVYVLVHGGTRWSQQARPTRPTAADATAGDRFGFSMAVGGAGALVGAPGKGSASGAAYVFVPSGAGWHQQARLSANDAAVSARFGFSVAFAGDTALIGAPGTNGGAGAAYMFVRSGTRWRQQARLSDSDSLAGDELGTAVSLSRNTALVGAGAPFNTHAGAAYVFVRSGTGWRQQVKLTASDGAAGDQFGLSAALSGSTAMVGAPFNTRAGAAYVFVRSGTGWRQQVKLTAGDGAAGDQFGLFVALSGATGLVGAPGKNTSTGVTYAFVHSALTANAPEPQIAG